MDKSATDSTKEFKEEVYGKYASDVDERVKIQNERRRWQNQLGKQVSHKALDEPFLEDDDMHIDARRKTTNTGLSGKAVLGLAAMLLPFAGLGGMGASVLLNQWLNSQPPEQPVVETPAEEPPPVQQPHEHSDRDTITIPKLDWGPERP